MHKANDDGAAPPLTIPLASLTRYDLPRAGGKGANLGELLRAGLPVPHGFTITTAAYDRFLAHSDLHQTIAASLRSDSGAEVRAGAAIRAAFTAAPIPPDVARQMLAAYGDLQRGAVAVRSSATAEDLPEAAFAGQQDTILNVVGDEALLDAVRRCWASLWTDRAIAYRQRLGLDQQAVKIAVVVQCMVDAQFAGVLFTANPVSGARDEIVIDASPGLGEAIVSGQVTPDHTVLRRRGKGRVATLLARFAPLSWQWRVADRRAGKRELVIRPRQGGGIEHISPAAGDALPPLPKPVLWRLAHLATTIERHFGAPQDVEWAWDGDRLFILQARPITALPDPPPRINKVLRHLASNFAEMLPVRPYPLDMDTTIPALGTAVEPIFVLLGLDWRFGDHFHVEEDVVVRFVPRFPRPTWRVLLAPLRLFLRIVRYDPQQWRSDHLLERSQARARELESRNLQALSWRQLLDIMREARQIPAVAGQVRIRYFPGAAFAAVRLRLLLALLRRGSQMGVLLSGVTNKTLEANLALEELARQARANDDLAALFSAHEAEALWSALEKLPAGRAFLDDLRAFLHTYGHRETMLSTALAPTWKDAPDVVLGMIKGFVADPPPAAKTRPAWQDARDDLLRRPLLRFRPLRALFLNSLAGARRLVQIREDTHFYAVATLPAFRRVAFEFARRLLQAGVLDAPEDVFHLTLDDLRRLQGPPAIVSDLRETMHRRKEKRAALENTPLVDPRYFPQSTAPADALLRGTSGSPGVAEGPVRLIRDVTQFDKLKPGDVLVAPHTNPAWTPLFPRAAAVVVDSGSPASHAAIVAREYGIPAVTATITATQTLQDGQRVRVDGNLGAVFDLSAATEPK